jgi:hypothetical protein
MIEALSHTLENTALNHLFKNFTWLVPAVQTIHILGIAIVLTTLTMLDVRLLRRTPGGLVVAEMSRNFFPWTWSALTVLLLTGTLLVIAEPDRELTSAAFKLKLVLVAVLSILSLILQLPLRRNPQYWDCSPERRHAVTCIAVVSLILCISIVAAGRLIAYLPHG